MSTEKPPKAVSRAMPRFWSMYWMNEGSIRVDSFKPLKTAK